MGRQFLVFLICGGVAALANIVSRWILSHWLPYSVAIVLAFCCGLIVGYVLFKFVVFKSGNSNRTVSESIWYVFVNLLALIQTLLISLFFSRLILPSIGIKDYADDIAHVIGVGIPVVTSYILHKYCTFKSCYGEKYE